MMEQMFRLLFLGLLPGLWLSLEAEQCQTLYRGHMTSFCCDTRSGKTCFTTYLAANNLPVRKPFEEASRWCKSVVPGSSLIIINSPESKSTFESFIGRQVFENETIIIDAHKLSGRHSAEWSWVNGYPTVPLDVSAEQLPGLDGACVESNPGQSLGYCTGVKQSEHRYICEYSDLNSTLSYRLNNKYYDVSVVDATWYDARNECLRLGGDLASITDLRMIGKWSQLKERQNQRYWIGLHRNNWIWNSTGAALTYTTWYGGYPEESSDKQCICINPKCRTENNRTICEYDRKWRSCNCNLNSAIACQKNFPDVKPHQVTFVADNNEQSDGLTIEIVVTEEMLPLTSATRRRSAVHSTLSAIARTTSYKTPIAPTPVAPSTNASTPPLKPRISTVTTYAEIERKTVSPSSMPENPSNYFAENQTSAFSSSSTGLFNSFTTREILLLILLLMVAAAFIIAAVILIIRKRKNPRRNEASTLKKTDQNEADSPEYETMVRNKRPSDDAVPIYTGLELNQHPMPSNTSSSIYANVQPTGKAVDNDINVIYADPNDV